MGGLLWAHMGLGAAQQFRSRTPPPGTTVYNPGQPPSPLLGPRATALSPWVPRCPFPTTEQVCSLWLLSCCPQEAERGGRASSSASETRLFRQCCAPSPCLSFPICRVGVAGDSHLHWCWACCVVCMLLLPQLSPSASAPPPSLGAILAPRGWPGVSLVAGWAGLAASRLPNGRFGHRQSLWPGDVGWRPCPRPPALWFWRGHVNTAWLCSPVCGRRAVTAEPGAGGVPRSGAGAADV